MTIAGKEGHDVRIESPRPAERDIVEPDTGEPEAVEPEAVEPENGESARAEQDAEHDPGRDERVGHEFGAAEPAAEPETGMHERVGEEPPTYERRTTYEHTSSEPVAAEPIAAEPVAGTHERADEERGIAEPVAATPHTGIYGRADEEPTSDEPDADDFAVAGADGNTDGDADEPVPYTPVTGEPVSRSTEPPEFGSPLIASGESMRFHEQIHQIQGMFVDDPRQSVRDAEHLLEDIVRSLASGLEERRRALTTFSGADGSGTEELRQALRSYRSLAVQLLGPEI